MRAKAGVRRTPIVEPVLGSESEEKGAIAAFMPARDEAAVIERSVERLAGQGDVLASVVVIDDGSTDSTAERLAAMAPKHPVLRVLTGSGPGERECGKPAALRHAVERTKPSAEWLLFVDADVVLEPGAVRGLLAIARARSSDLVTVFPRVELGSAMERVVMPAVGALIVARFPPHRVEDAADPRAFANGQVILVRRTIYETVGGHGAVVSEILEDVRLAERIKRAGGRVTVANGRKVATTRMYESWADLVEGWSKNLFLLMGSSVRATLAWIAVSLVLGPAGWVALFASGWPFGVAAFSITVGMQASLRRTGGASPAWAPFAPIGSIVLAALLLRSMWLHLAKRPVPWKGRSYG